MNFRKPRKQFTIPMNSMSDVAFLLLIFIMLVALINYRKEVKVDYPEAENAAKVTAEQNQVIWIQKDGAVYLDGDPATPEDIRGAVADIYTNAPGTQIHVIADRATPYEYINSTLEILQLLEYRVVSFVVKEGGS